MADGRRLGLLFVLAAFLWLAGAGVAGAQICNLQVRDDVSFGSYDPLATGNLDTTARFRYRCPIPPLIARVKITAGSGGGMSPRRMTNGAEALGYNLYLDPSRSVVWGDGSSGSSFLTLSPPSFEWDDHAIYARTALGQDVAAGSYDDTVVVVVEW